MIAARVPVARMANRLVRCIVAFNAAAMLAIASRLAVGTTAHAWLPAVWVVAFATAGVVSLVFLARIRSHRLWMLTGTLTMIALASRPVALVVGWVQDGPSLSAPQIQAACALYCFAAFFFGLAWVRAVGPMVDNGGRI